MSLPAEHYRDNLQLPAGVQALPTWNLLNQYRACLSLLSTGGRRWRGAWAAAAAAFCGGGPATSCGKCWWRVGAASRRINGAAAKRLLRQASSYRWAGGALHLHHSGDTWLAACL